MPRRLTFEDATALVKERADIENDRHIQPAELAAMMSSAYGTVYQKVASSGGRYWETTHTITVDGSSSYLEPADHLSTLGLDLVRLDESRRPLRPLPIQHRHRYAGRTGEARFYTIIDNRIFLYPKPSSGTYELLYIPQAPDLKSYTDADLFDLVTPDGEEMFIWGTVVKIFAKKEQDPRLAIAERDAAAERLLEWATMRSLIDGPVRVVEGDDDDCSSNINGSWNPASWRYR